MKRIYFLTTILLAATSTVSALNGASTRASAVAEPMPIPDEITLDAALDYALEHSFTILQAKERIEEQYGLIMEVGAAVLPTLSLNGSISEQADEMTSSYSTADNWSVALQVRQALYAGGGLRAAIRAQDALERAALYDLQASVESAIQEVKSAFYGILLARDTIEVETQNIELLEEQLANTESRFEAGSVSNFDVLQAKVALANAKPALIRAKNNFRVAVADFKRVVGYVKVRGAPTVTMPTFIGELEVSLQAYDLLESMQSAMKTRPELARLALLVDSNQEGIQVAKAGYLPSVDLIGSYNILRSFTITDDRFENPERGWYVGLEANWNIWDGRVTKGRVLQAKSQVRQSELTLDEARLSVEIEVRRAISELESAAELVEAAGLVTGQAEEALRLANDRYSVGSSTFLDTLQARVSLTEARNNQLQANYSYLLALTDVQRAIGETKYNYISNTAGESP
jgi:TolC family type I secretion outer membrane protein